MKIKILSVILLFSSCSSASDNSKGYKIESTGNVDVQVSIGGQRVADLDQQLIHRIEFSLTKLKFLKSPTDNILNLPFLLKKNIDQRGLVMGLKVVGSKPSLLSMEDFGFRENDLITAIGTKLLTSAKDFQLFVDLLESKGELSITLERNFQPHKILYSLSK